MRGSSKVRQIFDPLDLEIIDRVYETAWDEIGAHEPLRDKQQDDELQETLRKLVFAAAAISPPGLGNHVDFDNLCGRVLKKCPTPGALRLLEYEHLSAWITPCSAGAGAAEVNATFDPGIPSGSMG